MIAEYHAAYVKNIKRAPLGVFSLHLGLASFGVYMFAKPFISDETVAWIVAIAALVLGITALILAIIFAAKKKKS